MNIHDVGTSNYNSHIIYNKWYDQNKQNENSKNKKIKKDTKSDQHVK